jgi:hypothetical protein
MFSKKTSTDEFIEAYNDHLHEEEEKRVIRISDGGVDTFDWTIQYGMKNHRYSMRYVIKTTISKMKRLFYLSGLDHKWEDDVVNFGLHKKKDVDRYLHMIRIIAGKDFDDHVCEEELMKAGLYE